MSTQSTYTFSPFQTELNAKSQKLWHMIVIHRPSLMLVVLTSFASFSLEQVPTPFAPCLSEHLLIM